MTPKAPDHAAESQTAAAAPAPASLAEALPLRSEGVVVLLFTDLVGSTSVLERLGDVAAERVRRIYFQLLREAVSKHSGREVKSLGDGLMVVFGSAVDAVACAVAVQEAVQRHNHRHPAAAVWVRVGLHLGEPVRDEEDFFGTAVVVARRLCDRAAGGQILASELVRGLVDPRGQYGFRSLGRLTLKGLSERVATFEVTWGQASSPLPVSPTRRVNRGAGVLHTRLLPPRSPSDALDRPELVERILAGLEGRLVAVVAGAGYGKSTLLAQAMATSSVPWVWLSCDERIAGARPFLAHIGVALEQRFPGVAAQLALEGSVEEMVAELSNEVVATVGDDFVLAVDDVHGLAEHTAAEALGLLAQDLPSNAHMALASRTVLPFSLTRLWSAGVLEIGESALALSEEESSELLGLARIMVEPEMAAELHRRTEGWVAGLLLAVQTGATVVDPRLIAAGPHFDYLAEEVFGRLPPEMQDFLLDTAPLERFSADLADSLRGGRNGHELIVQLMAEHLFTVPVDAEGEWFRYHHLFHAFLRRRVARGGTAALADIHRRAGRAWMSAGDRQEAVRHFLEARDFGRAVEALDPLAERMVHGPDAETVAGWLDAIPAEHWAGRPSLILAHATLLLTRAQHEESFAAFERAIEQLLEAAEHERAATVLFRLLQTMVTAGTRPERRIATGRHYLPRIDPAARMLPAARILQAASYAFGCRFDEAEHELEEALGAPGAALWPTLRTYATIIRAAYVENQVGRSEEALAHLDEAIADLERRQADDLLGFLPFAHLYRGYVLTDLGRDEETLAEIPRIEDAALRRGLGTSGARVLRWMRFVALAGLGRWEELEAEFVPPDTSPGVEATCYSYRYRAPAALLAAHRGDQATVRAQVKAARGEMRSFGLATDWPLVLCSLAIASWRAGSGALAEELAGEAIAIARSIEDWTGAQARAALVAAFVARDPTEGADLLEEALELTAKAPAAQADLTELWTYRERALAGPLLARALAGGLGPEGLAARLLGACGGDVIREAAELLRSADPSARTALALAAADGTGVDAGVLAEFLRDPDPGVREAGRKAAARVAQRPRAPLELTTMGLFSVRRGGVPVSAWRPRSRALLAALLCARAPVHRDVLLEWFWPRLAPRRALGAFNTTLHDLRRALEPEIPKGVAPSIIVTHGESYALAMGEQDRWDAGELLRLASTPLEGSSPDATIERLLRAESQSMGTFLPEWPYEDWATPLRGEIVRARQVTLELLADGLVAIGQDRAAAVRYERLIESDPERESWHRALMRAHARLGERPLALRQYHACRRIVRDHLGVEPSEATRDLYRSLL